MLEKQGNIPLEVMGESDPEDTSVEEEDEHGDGAELNVCQNIPS